MSAKQSKSLLHFFAELGDLLAKYATESNYALMMAVISLVLWPVGAVIASLLIASLYVRAREGSPSTTPSATSTPSRPKEEWRESDWMILVGLVLIGWGLFQLLKQYVEIPGSVALIGLGVIIVLMAFATRRRGGESSD